MTFAAPRYRRSLGAASSLELSRDTPNLCGKRKRQEVAVQHYCSPNQSLPYRRIHTYAVLDTNALKAESVICERANAFHSRAEIHSCVHV